MKLFITISFSLILAISGCSQKPESPDYDEIIRRLTRQIDRAKIENDRIVPGSAVSLCPPAGTSVFSGFAGNKSVILIHTGLLYKFLPIPGIISKGTVLQADLATGKSTVEFDYDFSGYDNSENGDKLVDSKIRKLLSEKFPGYEGTLRINQPHNNVSVKMIFRSISLADAMKKYPDQDETLLSEFAETLKEESIILNHGSTGGERTVKTFLNMY
ncbi:MAG: hypothetical protein JW982_05945 [Spirochaetes bacterium]|nr:hypothetical protein [Spirochaetota bacterium]